MKVLSLFDGISCARVALDRAKIPVEAYYASEIDETAKAIAARNYPDTVQIGDVKKVSMAPDQYRTLFWGEHPNQQWAHTHGIDLLIGGSPCQDLSVAKQNRKGLKGERSGLFYEYLRILRQVKPKWFVLENVASMSLADRAEITREMGVEPIMIDAALVSAQSRKRLFWTNIPGVAQPEDRGIVLRDILEDGYPMGQKSRAITRSYGKNYPQASKIGTRFEKTMVAKKPLPIGTREGNGSMSGRVYDPAGKSVTLKAKGGGGGAKTGLYIAGRPRGKNAGYRSDTKAPALTTSSWEHNNKIFSKDDVRPLTAVECERLQSLPDGYTEGHSKTARIITLGNAFNVEVISHILSHIPQ